MSQVEVRTRPSKEQHDRRRRDRRMLDEVNAHNRAVQASSARRTREMGEDAIKYHDRLIRREASGQALRHRAKDTVRTWAKGAGVAEELNLE